MCLICDDWLEVWSCGVMFYELLMLDLPWSGNSVYLVQTRILKSAPGKLSGPYSPAVHRLVAERARACSYDSVSAALCR